MNIGKLGREVSVNSDIFCSFPVSPRLLKKKKKKNGMVLTQGTLVSRGFCNKEPQARWLKTIEMY